MNTSAPVFVVDDDDGHAYLIELNLRAGGLARELVRFSDGGELLDFLDAADDETQRPALILLDINMPGVDGITTLDRLKDNPATRPIPVVMLSTTMDPDEIRHCYDKGCALFLTKPVQYAEFTQLMKTLGGFLALAKLPSPPTFDSLKVAG